MKKLVILLILLFICTSFVQRKYKYSKKTYPLSELIKLNIELLKIKESGILVNIEPLTTEKAYEIYIKLSITNISNFNFKIFDDDFIEISDKDIMICYDHIESRGGEKKLFYENPINSYKYKPFESKKGIYKFKVCKQSNFKFKIKFDGKILKKYGFKILSNPKDAIYSNEIDIKML